MFSDDEITGMQNSLLYYQMLLQEKTQREKDVCFLFKVFPPLPLAKSCLLLAQHLFFIVLTPKLWTARRLIVCSLTHAPFQSGFFFFSPGTGLDSVNFACCCESSKTNLGNWLTTTLSFSNFPDPLVLGQGINSVHKNIQYLSSQNLVKLFKLIMNKTKKCIIRKRIALSWHIRNL